MPIPGNAVRLCATCHEAMPVLITVFAMRWNVVIGGQELSRTMKGLLDYQMPLFGREGLLASLAVFACPFAALWVLARILPPWLGNGLVKPMDNILIL
jgi:predicted membrane protein